jgi:hypothetical protein
MAGGWLEAALMCPAAAWNQAKIVCRGQVGGLDAGAMSCCTGGTLYMWAKTLGMRASLSQA